MRKIIFVGFLVLFFLSALLVAQPKETPLVFTHVNVIDVTSDDSHRAVKQDQTVVITGSRITGVGKTGKLHIPATARVIDATNMFMIPGLWDMHVHSLYEGRPELFFPMFIANGVTGVREMASTMSLDQISALRQRIQRKEVLGPRFGAITGKILETPISQLGPEFEPVAAANEARAAVRARRRGGADFVKVYTLLKRDVYFAIADEAKRQQLPFVGHVPFSVSALEAANAGQKSIEHLTQVLLACSTREEPLSKTLAEAMNNLGEARLAAARTDAEAAENFDPKKATQLLALFKKKGTWQCPTLVQRQKFLLINDPNFINDDRLRYVPLSVRERWRNTLAGPQSEMGSYAARSFFKQLELVKMMSAAGVGVLAGTDAGWGNPYTFAGFSLHDELALFVRAGLSPMEALQTATLNAARFLNVQDRQGSVAEMKVADLVLLEANPLADINNTRRIAAVVVDGRYLPKAELQNMLSEVEAAARKK